MEGIWKSTGRIVTGHPSRRFPIYLKKFNPVCPALGTQDILIRRNSTKPYSLESLIQAKDRKKLSFSDIAAHIGRSESWTAGLFFGKSVPESSDLEKLHEILSLSDHRLAAKQGQRQLPLGHPTSAFLDSNLTLSPVIREILLFPTSQDLQISAHGWIRTIRKQKKLSFIELIDGSTSQHLQIVAQSTDCQDLEAGCAIRVTGKLVSSRGAEQAIELKAHQITLVGSCPASRYPLQKKSHSVAFLRRIPHLRIRTPQISALMRTRSAMLREACSFLDSNHFFRVEAPIITFNDCEGAGEVFSVRPENQANSGQGLTTQSNARSLFDEEFFGRQAFLTVSGQLHLEALSVGLGRVYSFGPAFRAEKSQTNRHLAEFWMLEAELSFVENLDCLTQFLENLIKAIIQNLYQPNSPSLSDLESLGAPSQPYEALGKSWPRITYAESIKLIKAHNQQLSALDSPLPLIHWGQPLTSEHEKWLAGTYARGPIFVTDYPSPLKPFYMRETQRSGDRNPKIQNGELSASVTTVACFDLLVPGIGELVGGSLREPNLVKLKENMIKKGMMKPDEMERDEPGSDHSKEAFRWYLELRTFGNPSSGGFGIGWERLLSWLTGGENVRECISFPRVHGSGCC